MSASIQILAARSNRLTLFPGLLSLAIVWRLVPNLSPFAVMSGIAGTLFLLIKLHTLLNFVRTQCQVPPWRELLVWFAVWPGLDAPAFFVRPLQSVDKPRLPEWTLALSKTAAGLLLWTAIAPRMMSASETVAGWVALTGVALSLHFGVFHLLALFWRHQGRAVVPIMNAPGRATSLSDFWSRRWNLAFRDYAHFALFAPLTRRMSASCAILIGYLFSGLIHELAISVPAEGGYGLPTLYFGIQGCGVLLEHRLRRSQPALRSSVTGWMWTMGFTVGPVYVLFHPAFIHRVVVPMLLPFVP